MGRKMKDSGIEWIGEIPNDWDVVASKKIILNNDGGIWGEEPNETGSNTVVLRSTEQTVEGTWIILEPAKRNLSMIKNIE